MSEKPGPAVAVIAFAPAKPAPMQALIASISELAWCTNLPLPTSRDCIQTRMVVAGEMG